MTRRTPATSLSPTTVASSQRLDAVERDGRLSNASLAISATVDPAPEAAPEDSANCSKTCSALIDFVRLLAREAAREWSRFQR
jgi:hypothetical protein